MLFFDIALHTLDIAFVKAGFEPPMRVGCVNCSPLVTSIIYVDSTAFN